MRKLTFIPALFLAFSLKAQDPHFTQFYAAPMTVNPAYTGVFDGQLRFVTNFRRQWANLGSPYTTSSISLDGKLIRKKDPGAQPLNIGMLLMNDQSLNGAFRSNYLMLATSYHVPLDQDGYRTMGAGLSVTYGDRRIDFSSISFPEQFASGGYDLTLPTGEAAMQTMQPFVSVAAGLLYKYDNKATGTFFEVGVSGYHFNKPKQTVYPDKHEYLPVRYSSQLSFQQYLQEDIIFNAKALYQDQAGVSYFLGGCSIAKLVGMENKTMIGAGAWYRSSDAVSPYFFFEVNKWQVGITYDASFSDLRKGPKPGSSFELSLLWRLRKKDAFQD